jgi:pimeloyl-ACP methyl ester carboxylesterase
LPCPRGPTFPQQELRDDPLCRLTLPVLFVRGTKDPFATEGPVKGVMARMARPNRVQEHEVEGGGHSLVQGGRKGSGEALLEEALDAAAAFCRGLLTSP